MKEYEELSPLTREEILARIHNSNRDEKCKILYVSATIGDPFWAEPFLMEWVSHNDPWVAGSAIMALADLARIEGLSDCGKIIATLRAIAKSRPDISKRIDSALGDIEMYRGKPPRKRGTSAD